MNNFIIEQDDSTLIAYINNPPQNVLNENFFWELREIVERANEDSNVISVIITTALPKIFTVGADLKELLRKYGSKKKMRNAINNLELGHETYKMIEESPKPFIVAFKGLSYGGGIELGCACDIRIASQNALFAMPETRVAFIPGYGGTQRIPRIIGLGAAKKFIYTGEAINASHALKIGLVEEIVPNEKILERAIEIARAIAKGCPSSTALTKKAMQEGIGMNFNDALELEKHYFLENVFTLEWTEGLFAFIGKREPNFKRLGGKTNEEEPIIKRNAIA